MNNNSISQKKAWYIVLISSLMGCSISSAFPQFSMTVSSVAAKTGLSESFLLTTDTLKSASIVAAMLCSGFFYKKFGARITFIIALICTALPQFVIPYTSVPAMLIFWKLVQGFSSVIFPVFLLIIMDVISERQAGLATAVFNSVFYSGGGVGGTLAGFFIAKSGWLSSYFALGIIELVIGVIWLFTVKDTTKSRDSAQAERLKDEKALAQAASLNSEKVSSLALLKMPVVWLLILAFISTTFVIQAITVDLPLFSQWLGYNELESSKINTAVTIGLLAACLVSGQISDMVARRMSHKGRARILVMAVGPILIIIASLMLILLVLTFAGTLHQVRLSSAMGSEAAIESFFGAAYVLIPLGGENSLISLPLPGMGITCVLLLLFRPLPYSPP